MARPRQNKKLRSSLPKIRQRPKSKAALRNPRGNPIVAANWDNDATLSQNYKRLGLASKLNSRAGGTDHRSRSSREAEDSMLIHPRRPTKLSATEVRVERDPDTGAILSILADTKKDDNPLNDPIRELDTDSEDEDADGEGLDDTQTTGVVNQLRDQAALSAPKRPRQQSRREKEWIGKLVGKYGDDYRRMAMDRKLNPMQQTESDIRKRLEMWKGDSLKDAE